MKPNHLFTSLLAVTALLVASCSTPKMAQNAAVQDDVYNTTAQAKVYKPAAPVQSAQADTTVKGDYYGKSDPRYDMDYASRIDRFYYGSPYRAYYDPFYNYYGYNSFYGYNYGWGYSYGYMPFYNNYWGSYGYFGSPYFNNYWGPYSAYNYYGGGYYGGFGGGYWGGGGYYAGGNTYSPNYGARPRRGSENGVGRQIEATMETEVRLVLPLDQIVQEVQLLRWAEPEQKVITLLAIPQLQTQVLEEAVLMTVVAHQDLAAKAILHKELNLLHLDQVIVHQHNLVAALVADQALAAVQALAVAAVAADQHAEVVDKLIPIA